MSEFNPEVQKMLHGLSVEDAIRYWNEVEEEGRRNNNLNQAIRFLCIHDLYYLLVRACKRVDLLPCVGREGYIDNQFSFDRCREVEANPNGYIDLWSREHGKSSVVTLGLTLQDILKNPEVTIGIFSHTRPIAKAFLRTLMREIEGNTILHAAFPDVLCGTDIRAYAKFSEDDGIVLRRKSNPNEATVEAWGLVDGMPVSKHFQILLYDDIVVQGSVSTPEMIDKTMNAVELSYNLGKIGGFKRAVGTRYHFNDAYRAMIDRGTFKAREYPGKTGGTEDGESVLWSEEMHRQKRRDMGPHTYSSQILLNPKADSLQGFKREWIQTYTQMHGKTNNYLLVDPASSKKRGSDYTAMIVVGLATDGNYYVLDMIRDRLSLTERVDRLFELHRKWKPIQVRYEKYGAQSDIEHILTQQEKQTYRFRITEVGGQTKKVDRIGRLIPLFEQGHVYLPVSLHKTNYEKVTVDLVHSFIEEEFVPFPVGIHDDMCFVGETPVITDSGVKRIDEVTSDDRVLTRNGYKRVLKAWCKGTKPVITRFGITATPDHRVHTENRGWVSLDSLCRSDILLEAQSIKETSCEKPLNSMAGSITDTQMQSRQTTSDTSHRTINGLSTQECCTETSGSSITVQSQKDTTSTTQMETATTTKSETLSACQAQRIKWRIEKKEAKERNFPKIWNTSLVFESSQKHGTHLKKGENGTDKTPSKHSKICQSNPVSSAGKCINQKHTDRECAAKNAKTKGADACNEDTSEPVYDLMVDGDHEFFAWGVLVHNCDALARILEPDLPLIWPKEESIKPQRSKPVSHKGWR